MRMTESATPEHSRSPVFGIVSGGRAETPTALRVMASRVATLPPFRLSALPPLRLLPPRDYLFVSNAPTGHSQIPSPRVRVLGAGLDGRLRDHPAVRQRSPGLSARAARRALGMGADGSRAGVDGLDRGRSPPLDLRPPRLSPSLAQGVHPGRRDGGLGGVPDPAQLRGGADDDVHAAPLRHPASGRGHVHLHQLRLDRPVLRDRGAAGARLRRGEGTGPAGRRARPVAVRPVPRQPHDRGGDRRADGARHLRPAAGARPDPPGGRSHRAPEPARRGAARAPPHRHRRGPSQRGGLQQPARLAGHLLVHRPVRRLPRATSCWPATSRSARSASTPTSWTSCWCRRW